MAYVPIKFRVVYARTPHIKCPMQSLTLLHAQSRSGLPHLFTSLNDALSTLRLSCFPAPTWLLRGLPLPLLLAALLLRCPLMFRGPSTLRVPVLLRATALLTLGCALSVRPPLRLCSPLSWMRGAFHTGHAVSRRGAGAWNVHPTRLPCA